MIGMPAFDEDAQLAGEVHDLLARHLLLRDLELEDALVLVHLERLEAALDEQRGAPRRPTIAFSMPVTLSPVGVEGGVAVISGSIVAFLLLTMRRCFG